MDHKAIFFDYKYSFGIFQRFSFVNFSPKFKVIGHVKFPKVGPENNKQQLLRSSALNKYFMFNFRDFSKIYFKRQFINSINSILSKNKMNE